LTVKANLDAAALRSPRSAAYAGGVFALLLIGSLVTIHFALPKKPSDSADLLLTSPERQFLLIGLSLIPFAGVAFLWFVGVLRERIGDREDKFFATVFLGSGLLFVAVLLVAEALTAAMFSASTRVGDPERSSPPSGGRSLATSPRNCSRPACKWPESSRQRPRHFSCGRARPHAGLGSREASSP
jgi:hypothetical protein